MSSNSQEYQTLVKRWDGFLAKIKDRYNEVIESSKEPLQDMILNLEFDSVIIHNALQGIKNLSVFQLDKKIDEGWAKMEIEAEKLNINYGLLDTPRENNIKTSKWLWTEFEKFSIKISADAARQIEKNIRAGVDENMIHNCVSCGGPLPVEIWSFQAINVNCPNCGSVNTYEPDGRVRAYEGVILTYAQEYAMDDYMNRENDSKSLLNYYKKYYSFIIEKLPQRKEYYERILNDKLTNPKINGSS